MPTETVMDAVNAALGDAAAGGEQPQAEEEVVTTGEEPVQGDGPIVEDEGNEPAGEVDGEGSEGEESAEAPVDLDAEAQLLGVSKRNANGTFKTAAQFKADVEAAKAAETAKAGTKAPGAQAAAQKQPKKPADPVNDPIPTDLKPQTQARMRTLIDRTKASEAKAAEVQQNFDYMVQGVQATGATPEQYGETLSWLSLFNSGDPKQQSQALEIIEDVADRLATMLGVERKVNDPLAAHLDLQQAVQKGQITAQFAKEMARQRNQGAFRTQMQTAQSEQQRQQQAAEQEREQARVDLNTLEQSLRASDPLYDRKRALIMPTLKIMFPQVRPSQWKDTFTKLYREAKVGIVPQPRTVTGQQPMRANKSGSAAGGGVNTGNTGPKSGLDAINAALASMGK